METRKRSAVLAATNMGFESADDNNDDQTNTGVYDIDASGDGPVMHGCDLENNENFTNFDSPPKKQKLDKDGFLTPATPDIPRQSVHRDPRAKHHDSGEMGSEDVKLPHGENPVECNQSDVVQSSDLRTGEAKNKDAYQPFALLIKQLLKESTESCLQFEQGFSGMESYELFCITRLHKMLSDATSLECQLLQQRDQLRRRVQQLSQSLKF